MPNTSHTWNFFRSGEFDQVNLLSAADLANLDQLDQKLWVALACPASGLEFDTATLALVDSDKDGRIRAPEIIAAAKWAASCLKNPDVLLQSTGAIPLAAISDATPDGKAILGSARQILADLGKKDATEISLADTADTARIFAQTKLNGDGIVPADAAGDDATKAVINDILACLGAETDRSGKPGVSQAKVDLFFAELDAFSKWWAQAETSAATVLPLGDKTPAAFAAYSAVKTKVDDYFARVRLAAFDARALAALNRQETEYLALAAQDLSITASEVSGFPLARVEAGKALPLKSGLNPAWAGAVAALDAAVVTPLVGAKDSLTEADWAVISAKLGAYGVWNGAKAGASVEKLGIKRVREILATPAKDAITKLIAADKALEPEANAIANVDKLLHYQRDLLKLLNNFVAFRDFYSRKEKAVFQVGTLFMDARSCDLCILVQDAGRHASLAALAGTYLMYCDCTRKSTGEKMSIVAAMTDGDSDNLMVGRNGIFYDRRGRDWDATITKIVDNPISIRQAFWAPYKRFVRAIEEMVAKRAAAADAASTAKMNAAAEATANVDKTTKPAEPKKVDVGTVAAIGVAISGAITALTLIVGKIFGLAIWQYPLVLLGIVLVISGPSMLIAWLKLRKRNLAPLLDANGWAVNARARITVPFGKTLTQVATIPGGSHRNLNDPFAEKKRPWGLYLVLVLLIGIAYTAWYRGWLDKKLPEQVRSVTVLGTNAPAYKPAPEPAAPAAPATPAP